MSERTKVVNSAVSKAEMHRLVDKLFDEHKYVEFDWRIQERQRTLTQSASLHLWFRWLAETLNDAGLDMRQTIKEGVEIPWSEYTIKEHIWKPVQKALQDKESTTQANRTDYTEVRDAIAEHLYNRFGVVAPPWPKREDAE